MIRHKDDYAAMLLVDQRYSQDRIKNKLSGWIRQCVTDPTAFGPNFSQLVKVFNTDGGLLIFLVLQIS